MNFIDLLMINGLIEYSMDEIDLIRSIEVSKVTEDVRRAIDILSPLGSSQEVFNREQAMRQIPNKLLSISMYCSRINYLKGDIDRIISIQDILEKTCNDIEDCL